MEQGEVLSIVGESGCGKTSMSLALMRLLPRNSTGYSGHIFFHDEDLMKLSDEELRKIIRWKKIAMVFQGALNSLNPVMRIEQQLAEPLILDASYSRDAISQRITELIGMVHLPNEILRRYPHELSGGMKQRVLIAMSLVLNPQLVILDEPTSALDVSIQAQIMNLLKDLKNNLGISFIFITHDISLASDISDRVAVMYAGEIVEIGSSEQILLKPKHPYTIKLLQSIPTLKSNEPPKFIPGSPPDLSNPPSGCRFHPRCDMALAICSKENPQSFLLNNGQRVNCWLLKENI
jgi:peptide/nickel transport system ATP-binding protein